MRAAIVFAVLLALGPVLWRITRSDAAPRPAKAATPQPAEAGSVGIMLTFSHPATKVAFLHLGKEVWSKSAPSAEEEAKLDIPWPREGVELRTVIEWPPDARAAMRLRLTDPAGNEYERTVWGQGAADEVLTFP
ncbi:MAG: hypothetical protein ABMA01_04750 [Chthoniobacteraceae bacterium]